MKRTLSLLLIFMLFVTLLSGCGGTVSSVKIDLEKYNYTVREDAATPLEPSTAESETLENYLSAISAAIESTPAEVYTFDLSNVAYVTEEEARNYLIPSLINLYGEDKIIEKTKLNEIGAWAVPTDAGLENDIKELWVSAFRNADGLMEYVIDVLRDGITLKHLRYVMTESGTLSEKQNTLTKNYDGTEPADPMPLTPEETGTAKTLFFGGRLNKTGIFELPVLNSIDFQLKIVGSPVPGGNLPGGFAGGFEGVVTIDGLSFPLTLDAAGMAIPTGLVDDPSAYYIAFSQVGFANPQDTTTYRNVYFIKKDLSGVIGLYFINRADSFFDYFETTRISSASFDRREKEQNERLTSLYSKVIVQTYGNRKEYNNVLAVLYNMFIGVNQDYLVKNLKTGIASVSRDIRDYRDAINDSTIARKGENGFYFFPDGRSMVVRLFAYDGASAIAAIDFSSMQDDGYGALYRADLTKDGWVLTTLQNSRIK